MSRADPRVKKLLDDLNSGVDISENLAELWPVPPAKQALSRPDSLRLANSIVTRADTKSHSAIRAYHKAIKELRILSPYLRLQSAKSSHPMARAAHVEKYAVNYALTACDIEHDEEESEDNSSMDLTASDVAEESLRLLFEARHRHTKSIKMRTRSARSRAEINTDSDIDIDFNIDCLFGGASRISTALSVDDFLPRDETAAITSVVLAAISVRVSAKNDAFPVAARLRLARLYGQPWAKHLGSFGKVDEKYSRKMAAYNERMRNGLLRAVEIPSIGTSAADQALANAYLYSMCTPRFTEFCRNTLRIANKFLQSEPNEHPPSLSLLPSPSAGQAEKYWVVSAIFRDALLLTDKTSIAAVDWIHEDVSALLDKIILVEGRCRTLSSLLSSGVRPEDRIPKDVLVRVLMNRRDALATLDNHECEAFVSNLQEEMVANSCYELLFENSCMDVTCEMVHLALKETALPNYLSSVDKLFSAHSLASKMGRKKRMCRKTALRLIRVLEPFCAQICSLKPALTKEQIELLQLYVCSVVLGLQATKCGCEKIRKDRLSEDDIRERLVWNSRDVLDALVCLLSAYIRKGDEKRIGACSAQIDAFVEQKPYAKNKGWELWLFSRIQRFCNQIFKEVRNPAKNGNGYVTGSGSKEIFNVVGNTLLATTKWLERKSCAEFGTQLKEQGESGDYLDSIILAVKCYLEADNNECAEKTVAHHLVRSFCFEPCALEINGGVKASSRYSFLRAFAKVTRLIEAKKEENGNAAKFADFVHLIALGKPLSGHIRNVLGRNFVMALSEYAVHVRQSYEVNDFTGSRYIRSAITGRYNLLKSLKLSGKCFNLQVHLEWSQLLLQGISVGKEEFKAQGSQDNLLSLEDITADTPCGDWSSSMIEFDNGACIEVALTPRMCRCQVCSGDGFALLHILRDSWRLAVQKQPPLLREHLWRLEKFLSACDMNTLDNTLVILCLDFLEWCQVFSILSSIHDQTGIMSSMIRKLKKHLSIVSKFDVGAIYSSHGFLAGRPYYSGLIKKPKKGSDRGDDDIRVSFFEKEEFMYTGCRADVHLRNLEFEKAFSMAKKSLILVLQRLKKHDDQSSGMRTEFTIGGIQVAIHDSIASSLDRLRALETLELIHALERVATVNLQIEDFNDANYYFQKASLVSKQLCGVESLIHLRQKKVVFKNNNALSTRVPLKEVDQFLKSGIDEISQRKHGKFDNTLVSNSYTVVADVALAAIEVDDEYNEGNDKKKRLTELGQFASKFLRMALDSLAELQTHTDTYTGAENNNNNNNYQPCDEIERVNSIMFSDVSLRTGEAELLLGNVKVAIEIFEKVKNMSKDSQANSSYLLALLGLSSALIYKLGGPENVAAIMRKAKEKKSRGRQTKKMKENRAMAVLIANNLREGESILGENQWEPYRRMEFFMLHALIFGPMDAANKGLAWEIGSGFTIRWNMKKNKEAKKEVSSHSHSRPERELESTMSMSISTAKQRQLLTDANIVVIGISLDSSNGALIFWRYMGTGFFTAKLKIPTQGNSSYDALLRRFSAVADGLKRNALPMKTGESFSSSQRNSWWAEQFKLDTEMRNILADVEDDWFGSSKLLLLPAIGPDKKDNSIMGGNDGTSTSTASNAAHALVSIQAVYSDECSEDSLVQAFDRLNITAGTEGSTLSDFWKDTDISSMEMETRASIGGNRGRNRRGNAVFVIDSRLEFIPFECLPILRNNKVGSTRIPSLSYLFHQLEFYKPISRRTVYYLLNPGGDLRRTEAKFRAQFERRKDWSGISGTIVAEKLKKIGGTISRGAQNADVFLYCGHGTGEKYVTPEALISQRKKDTSGPVAVLMGCSSAKLKRHGGFRGSSGALLEYLMNGAPAVGGNLWDVTDKDVDRLTEAFLANWLGTNNNNNRKKEKKSKMGIADALAEARTACKLPHLVGAATIVYGLPFL